MVAQDIAIADHGVTGSYRYAEKFQILPMPNAAPKQHVLMGDHPLVLEVAYSSRLRF